MKMAVASALLLFGIGAAQAQDPRPQDHPLYMPVRDVSVTYRLSREGGPATAADATPREAHMYFTAGRGLLRIDEPTQRGYAVIDRAAEQVTVVIPARRAYAQLPMATTATQGFMLSETMSYTRTGTDTVAGLPCTVWRVHADQADGSVCVTADGVILRGQGRNREGRVSKLEAQTVTYGPLPPSLFETPPDYTKIEVPHPPERAAPSASPPVVRP